MSNYFDLPSEGELELAHHGILGQKWGIRRYQNSDGSLTEAGRARYGTVENLRKIQNAKADAEAYRIRRKADSKNAKAQAKLENKIAKAELRREKKILKAENKYQIKADKKYNREMQKENQRYYDKNRAKNSAKNFASEAFNQMVKPALLTSGRNLLTKYADEKFSEFGMSEAEKRAKRAYNAAKKELERVRVYDELSSRQANMNENSYRSTKEYRDYRTNIDRNKIKRESDFEQWMTDNYETANYRTVESRRKRYDIASGKSYNKSKGPKVKKKRP